jgi:hypothetical protein
MVCADEKRPFHRYPGYVVLLYHLPYGGAVLCFRDDLATMPERV